MQSFQATRIPLVFGIWADSQGIIVAIENPSDIIVASQRPYGSRAVLKFSSLDWTVQCTWGDLCGINVVRFWIMVWWLLFDEFCLWVVIDVHVHFGCGVAIPHSSQKTEFDFCITSLALEMALEPIWDEVLKSPSKLPVKCYPKQELNGIHLMPLSIMLGLGQYTSANPLAGRWMPGLELGVVNLYYMLIYM